MYRSAPIVCCVSRKPRCKLTGQEKTRQELANLAPLPEPLAVAAVDNGEKSLYFNPAKFEQAFRASKLLASSQLVPEHYQRQPQNCFIALQVADRMQIDPFLYMQNTYVVHGKPGLNGALAIALINKQGPFIEPIRFEYAGDYGKNRQCTAIGVLASGRECSAVITWAMVVAEGWLSNSKWTSIPDQMLSYRSAAFLGRLYCPEVLMGMQTVDELIDAGPSVDAGDIEELPAGNEGLKAHLAKTVDNEALGEAIETTQPQCPEDLLPESLRAKAEPPSYPTPDQDTSVLNEKNEILADALRESRPTDLPGPEPKPEPELAKEPEPVYTCPTCKMDTVHSELTFKQSQRKNAEGVCRTIYFCPGCLIEAKI